MILFPAIDLKDGQCVRLKLGDMDQATVFNDDPAAQAKSFSISPTILLSTSRPVVGSTIVKVWPGFTRPADGPPPSCKRTWD